MSNPRAVAKSNRTRIRTKVYCFCKECNGKLVDPRTKTKHGLKYNISYANNNFSNNYQEAEPSNANPSNNFGDDYQEAGPSDVGQYTDDNNAMECEPLLEMIPIHESAKHKFTKKGKISDHVLENLLPDNGRDMNDDQDRDFEDYDDENRDSESFEDDDEDGVSSDFEDDDEDSNFGDFESDEEYRDSEDFEDDDEEEVNFASKDFDDGEPKLPNINNDNYTWIILWILQYQQRYKLPNVSIDSLFKFLRFFLLMVDENKFSSFSSSLYVAKKILGISTNIIKYAACNKCHKLYDINEISNTTEVPTCSFINYPNHSIERFRQKCNNPLVKKIDSNKDGGNNPIIRPIMTFPLVNIRRQLTLFFGRKDFEVTCRKWAERENETEALFDIYDGRIWMSFEDGKGESFFKKEYTETHIGLMLNMDCDVPATRKLCGFISARIACYRCYKSANLVNNQPNFGGFEDIDDWFVERDINLIREKAREWKKCATEESRKAHVLQYHVRWSEVYQLPYFNSVRFCVVDPMHCLFLGVAKWIVMKLWIDKGILNNEKLKIMQERADLIKFLSDLGHRPVRIATGDGFSNFTADMWKTPNLHLCLHICECALDYGPLSSFWCFSFERMNGILGSYKNSKRNIEPELLKIMVESSFLNYYLTNCDSNILNTTLDIIKPRKSAGSLAALDDFTSDEYQNFLRLSLIENESAYGTERFPGLLMKPRQETCLPNRVLDLLVEFYNSLYEEHFVPIYSITGPNNDIVVISKIIQYGRIRIGADIFGSIQAARHEKSSYILARFEQEDGTIDTYPGQVQFYFEHTIYLKNSSSLTHSLALVKWYRPAQDHRTRYFCQVDDDIKSCNIELWTNGFYDMSRDSIIPVHHILGKFIKCDFNIETRKIKEYMAVIPLNKKISF
ncbi:hypothetical protein GLOIN_2v1788017 [Rhizophagus irregularis DAOM 181602=DAOM 197198]|nr:hypothetical protein GLOIN_2v1788017 [Rhizophagus irregularis DAOM 181602=DAOM 197198]GET54371.1 hypothetical protein GLOIN_2v1788017 [Rhizophagus irregularis DAOM 181602=DAOM 197198]